MNAPIMRSADFHGFMLKLDQEVFARDFILFVLGWASADQHEIKTARMLSREKAIRLSKELFPLFVLESITTPNTTKH